MADITHMLDHHPVSVNPNHVIKGSKAHAIAILLSLGSPQFSCTHVLCTG